MRSSRAGLHVYIALGLSKNGHFTSYSGQLAVYYDYSCMYEIDCVPASQAVARLCKNAEIEIFSENHAPHEIIMDWKITVRNLATITRVLKLNKRVW